jgi:hypothetical protein
MCWILRVPAGPYDLVTTPADAWVKDVDATSSTSYTTASTDVECEAACQGISLCQYYIFRADQDPEDYNADPKLGNGCFFKMAPNELQIATDTYTAFKLWTGDYVMWEVSVGQWSCLECNSWAAVLRRQMLYKAVALPGLFVANGVLCLSH